MLRAVAVCVCAAVAVVGIAAVVALRIVADLCTAVCGCTLPLELHH